MKKILQLLLVALVTMISSCKKNEVTTNPDPIVPFDNSKSITTIVAGKVTAQDGTPLNNVEITVGTTTTVTDADGNFMIPKATLSEKNGFIKATKTGYFAGSRTITAKEKVVNNVVIQLIKKTTSGNFTNASGGTITIATGGSIVFPTNAVVTKSGAAYTGSVTVSAYFLDPSSENCFKEMPGDLRGINTSNNEQVLTSYGMMTVELNGSNGEALQLATGKNATLTFPIVAATQSAVPATIPLWFFDETKGMWVEQGTATKTGNTYVGTVSHFTWWNCDWGGGPLNLTATFVDQSGNALSNYHVYYVTSNGWGGGGGHGWTASDGSLTGNIPANTPIIIKVIGSCGSTVSTIYTSSVGPFTQSTNLGTITVTLPTNQNTVSIKGNVVDCSGNAVANGYALIKFNNNYYYTSIVNGSFNKTIVYCSTTPTGTATVDVFDLATLKKKTTASTVNITGSGVFNIGQVAACGVQTAVHYIATFIDQNGANLSQYYISFDTIKIYPQSATINTIIPANKILTRKVYAYTTCGGYVLVDSTQIGPFASDFNAGNINVTVPQSNALTFKLSGTVNTCSNTPVLSGSASLNINGATFVVPIINGVFNFTLGCVTVNTQTINVTVTDDVNHQKNSTPITMSVTNGVYSIGTVQACGVSVNEFLNYTFDGTTYNLDSLQARQQNLTYISGFVANPNSSSFSSNFNGFVAGNYAFNINMYVGSLSYITTNNVANANATVTISEYGNVGQYIAGTFSGNVLASGTTVTKPISGSFRIKRTQ